MRKTLNINLGGLAFIIDENAFELLHNYLETLKRKFSTETGGEEILQDIESRIAEMLSQKLADRKEVIGIEDVQSVINIMGKPEDIAGEETTTAASPANNSSTTSASTSPTGEPVKRKLFRDPDDAKIGGVISGLCHYFGINDPIWVRIAALILIVFTSGSIIIFYLLLLVIVPKANTAAEKLQMKGEPVNISTIEKEIKDAASKAGESVQRFVKDQNFFERLGHIIISIATAILKVAAVFVLCIAMVSLIGILLGYTGFYVWGNSPSLLSASNLLVEKSSSITLFGIGFVLFCATPFIALIYVALRALIGQRSSVPWLKWTLLGGWVLGLVLLVISAGQIGLNFKTQSTRKQLVALAQPTNGKLLVQLTNTNGEKINPDDEDENEDNENITVNPDVFMINGVNINDMDKIPLSKPALQLIPSENDSFYIQEIITSHGRSKKDAEKNADVIAYAFSQADTVLNLTPRIYLPKTGKWRLQKMTLRIAIPEGKKVSFADNIDIWAATVKGDYNYDDTQFANTTWTTEGGKVKCIAGENHKNGKEEGVSEPGSSSKKANGHKKKITIGVNGDDDKNKDDNDDKDY